MKKKILSLILVLMLLPIASLFGACGKNDGYNLNNLEKDFKKIAKANDNVELVEGVLTFDYSNHPEVQTVINSTEPYTSLNNYNYVFYNLMNFACSYIDECSNNSSTNNVKIKNNIEQNLDELSKSINDVNECFNMFAEMVHVSQSNPTEKACLSRYENLIKTYEDMYQSAINFSNSLSNLYYNHILKDGNPNVYSIGLTNFDANMIITKFESRIKYQLSNLSQSFVEMYIGGNLADKIVNQETTFDLTQNDYSTKVQSLNKQIESIQIAVEKANHEDNKQNFYSLAVQAQNIQEMLNNDREKFVEACNSIDYITVKASLSSTAYEDMCVSIIESNYDLVTTYNGVLSKMLDIVANS